MTPRQLRDAANRSWEAVTHVQSRASSDDAPGYRMLCGAIVFIDEVTGMTFPPTFDFFHEDHAKKATCPQCRLIAHSHLPFVDDAEYARYLS